MNKKKIETTITMALILVLFIAAMNMIGVINRRKKSSRADKDMAFSREAVSEVLNLKDLEHIKAEVEQITYNRNPFDRTAVETPKGTIYLHLYGIIWDEDNPHAIIGDDVVGVGDILGKYTVTKITRDTVTVKSDEGTREIKIWRDED